MRRLFVILFVCSVPLAAWAAWDSAALHDRGPQVLQGSLEVRGGPVKLAEGAALQASDAGIVFNDGTRQTSAERLERLTLGSITLEGADAGISFADGTRLASAPVQDEGRNSLERRLAVCDRQYGTSYTFRSSLGDFSATVHGTNTLVRDAADTWVHYVSVTSLNAYAGLTVNTQMARWDTDPRVGAKIQTRAVSGLRTWVALAGVSLNMITLDGTTSTTEKFAGAAFDLSYSPYWQCCAGNGSGAYGCTATPVLVQANSVYRVLFSQDANKLTCEINGVATDSSSPAPNDDTGAKLMLQTINLVLDEAPREIRIARFFVEST